MRDDAEREVRKAERDMDDEIRDMEHHLEELGEDIEEARAEDRHMQQSGGIQGVAGDWEEADEGEPLQGGSGDDPEGA
jgi:hypothetical protein